MWNNNQVSWISSAVAIAVLSCTMAVGQDPARPVKKAVRDYEKALEKEQRRAEREAFRAARPGSKELPMGPGQGLNEFRLDRLRLGDLGISLVNRGPGLVIEQIDPQSALAKFGLQDRDRIVAVGDHRVEDERELIKYLFAPKHRSGRVGLWILHDDDRFVEVRVEPSVILENVSVPAAEPKALNRLGVTLGDRNGNELRVIEVTPQSPADAAGLRRGDIILQFNGRAINSAEALAQVIEKAEPGVYSIEVARDESEPTLRVKLR